jgi:hypothetical protein
LRPNGDRSASTAKADEVADQRRIGILDHGNHQTV